MKKKKMCHVLVHRFVYECLSVENLEEGDLVFHKEGKTFDNRFSKLRKSNAKKNAKNKKNAFKQYLWIYRYHTIWGEMASKNCSQQNAYL